MILLVFNIILGVFAIYLKKSKKITKTLYIGELHLPVLLFFLKQFITFCITLWCCELLKYY